MAPLELHILGPALGLPSIDAECTALAALLSLPLTKNLSWKLVIAHDSSASPTGDFPLLKHGRTTIAGFRPIVRYLKKLDNDIDDGLSPHQQATVTGIAAHLRLRAQPLLDAHLYADSQNYVHTTRPAFSRILPFPHTWLVPPVRAERASQRASHLASQTSFLSSSVPSAHDAQKATASEQPGGLQTTTSPSLLFARSEKARQSLAQQVGTVRIRLASAVDALCEPLAELLELDKDKRGGLWLIRGKFPTSADCLAFGYLSLLLEPDVPNRAVTELVVERWWRVVQYYNTLKSVLSLEKSAGFASASLGEVPLLLPPRDDGDEQAYSTKDHAQRMQGLPWFRAAPPSILQRVVGAAHVLLNAVVAPHTQRRLQLLLESGSRTLILGLCAGTSLGVATVAYAAFSLSALSRHQGLPRVITFAARRAAKGGGGAYGEAGALLGLGAL